MPKAKKELNSADNPEISKQMKEILSLDNDNQPEKKKRGRPKKVEENQSGKIQIKKVSENSDFGSKISRMETVSARGINNVSEIRVTRSTSSQPSVTRETVNDINIDELFDATLSVPQKPFEYNVTHETITVSPTNEFEDIENRIAGFAKKTVEKPFVSRETDEDLFSVKANAQKMLHNIKNTSSFDDFASESTPSNFQSEADLDSEWGTNLLSKRNFLYLLAVVAVLLVSYFGYVYFFKKPELTLLEKVAIHTVVPENEIPKVYKIEDAELLKSKNPAFSMAENGDSVVLYEVSQKMVIFRESLGRVIVVMDLKAQIEADKKAQEEKLAAEEAKKQEELKAAAEKASSTKATTTKTSKK